MAEAPAYRSYVAGRLALAGLDLSTPVGPWLDAVYAIILGAPHEALEKMMKHMTIQEARLRPEEARATWGLRPEHRALAGSLGQGPGAEEGNGGIEASRERVADWSTRQRKSRPSAGARPPRMP